MQQDLRGNIFAKDGLDLGFECTPCNFRVHEKIEYSNKKSMEYKKGVMISSDKMGYSG
jgi:hypothetical protein